MIIITRIITHLLCVKHHFKNLTPSYLILMISLREKWWYCTFFTSDWGLGLWRLFMVEFSREGSLADIQFSICCTIQRMESHLTSEAPESYRDITQCWHLRHWGRLRGKKMTFGMRFSHSYLINDCTRFFPLRPAPLRRHPGVFTSHLWPLRTWKNHTALRRQKQRAPVNRPANCYCYSFISRIHREIYHSIVIWGILVCLVNLFSYSWQGKVTGMPELERVACWNEDTTE